MFRLIKMLAILLIAGAIFAMGNENGKLKERTKILKTSSTVTMYTPRTIEDHATNYVFYDETYAQVVSIYSDLKEAEVVRLVRYTYPKECELTLLSIRPVGTVSQGLAKPSTNIIDESLNSNTKDKHLSTTLKQQSGESTVIE